MMRQMVIQNCTGLGQVTAVQHSCTNFHTPDYTKNISKDMAVITYASKEAAEQAGWSKEADGWKCPACTKEILNAK